MYQKINHGSSIRQSLLLLLDPSQKEETQFAIGIFNSCIYLVEIVRRKNSMNICHGHCFECFSSKSILSDVTFNNILSINANL